MGTTTSVAFRHGYVGLLRVLDMRFDRIYRGWLFNSKGEPIAFATDGHVFFVSGVYLGRLEGDEVWYARYKGEVLLVDRLLRRRPIPSVTRAHGGTPASPSLPQPKPRRQAVQLPAGFEDIKVQYPWVDMK